MKLAVFSVVLIASACTSATLKEDSGVVLDDFMPDRSTLQQPDTSPNEKPSNSTPTTQP